MYTLRMKKLFESDRWVGPPQKHDRSMTQKHDRVPINIADRMSCEGSDAEWDGYVESFI